jgi:hypothetical protein
MRNFIIALSLIIIFSFINLNAGEKLKIFFKNGCQISGEFIDSVPGKSIKIKPEDIEPIEYQLTDITKIVKLSSLYKTKGIYGFGLGVQYGVIGGSIELNAPFGYSSAFLGIGTTGFSGLGWAVGTRFYPLDFSSKFLPRLTLCYGTNSILAIEKQSDFNLSDKKDYESGTGFSIGAGLKWLFGETHSWGMDFDIYYILNTSLTDRLEELKNQGYIDMNGEEPKIDIAIGFVFTF